MDYFNDILDFYLNYDYQSLNNQVDYLADEDGRAADIVKKYLTGALIV